MATKSGRELHELPAPGTVFIAPMADGRLCAGRVLRRQFEEGANRVLVAGSAWIGTAPPSIGLPQLRKILYLNHHSCNDSPNILWTGDLMPADFRVIGHVVPAAEDLAIECCSYGAWQVVPTGALLQWRWDHDRDALLREQAEEEGRRSEDGHEHRSSWPTLEELAHVRWFSEWDIDSIAAANSSRGILEKLIDELRRLPVLQVAAVRKLLKRAVAEFNELDDEHGFIDTVLREDICEALERIAGAVGLPQLVDQIDRWRRW